MKIKILVLLGSLVCLIGIVIFQYFKYHDGKFHVVFCDVGQGDGIYMRTPQSFDIIVDAGPDSSILDCLDRHKPFWDRTIELAFATHPDADHISGFIELGQQYKIKSYNTSMQVKNSGVLDELKRMLDDRNIKVREIVSGDSYKTPDGIKLETLWPQQEYKDAMLSDDTNSYSLVQYVTYKDVSVFLTGDITFDILNQLIEEAPELDIFKAAHHGSYTGMNEETFQSTKPQFVVISNGKNNRYGHPHASVLKILKENAIPYGRTDELGDIEIVSDGKEWKVKTQN